MFDMVKTIKKISRENNPVPVGKLHKSKKAYNRKKLKQADRRQKEGY